MLKSFSPHTCAFDCEWTPCPTTARRLLGLPADTDDRTATAAVWEHYRKDSDKDPQPFLKLVLSKVVTIAAVIRRQDAPTGVTLTLYAHHCDEAGEAALIRNFLEMVAAEKLQLWGFNSAQSDVPILVQRAVALGVPIPQFSNRPAKPFGAIDYFDSRNSEAHVDIANVLGSWGGGAHRPSLHELAIAAGIPGKLETQGSDVAGLYLDGRIADIVEYNETDAVTTHLLMLRIAYVAGKLEAAAYRQELAAVERLVQGEIARGKAAFGRFDGAWVRERVEERPAVRERAPVGAAAPVAAAPVAAAAAPASPPVARPGAPDRSAELWARWKELVHTVKVQVGQQPAAALQAVRSVKVAGETVTCAFGKNEFSRGFVEKNVDAVAAVMAAFLGVGRVELVCLLGDGAGVQSRSGGFGR